MPSKLGGHFMSGSNPAPWVEAGAGIFKFTPDTLGMSAQVPAGPLVVGKLDQQDAALNLTDWKALMNRGIAPKAAADLRFNAQININVGPNKPPVNRYAANPRVDVWEDDNEVVPDNQAEAIWYSTYCIEMMKLYEAIGKRRANFSFAVGTPDMSIWPHLLPAVRYARDRGHYIALHEYMGYEADYGVGWKQVDANRQPTTNVWHGRPDKVYPWGWAALRYRYIYDTVFTPAGVGNVKLLITEAGCDSVESVTPVGRPVGSWKAMGLSENVYTNHLVWYDGMIRQDSYVAGAVIFTVGSVGIWVNWDISGTAVEPLILAQIANLADVPDEPPPTDPTDPPPDGQEPVANLLQNPSFEEGWTDSDAYTTTQNPKGWTVEWNIGPGFPNPHGGQTYLLGECVHKSKAMLPPSERDVFVSDGDWTLKLFAGDRSFWARLKQTIDLPAGRYQLATPVWVDCYRWSGFKDYAVEPWQAETMVKANGREVKPWSLMVSGTRARPVTVFDHPGGPCALAVHFRCNWAISNNLWLDGWTLERVAVTPPVDPPPVAPVKVLDISKWQGAIDPARMLAAGVTGVMVRASYSGINGSRADEKVEEYLPLLRAANIPYGLYHYFHPARPVEEQFGAFAAVVERHGYQLRLALDLEETVGFDATTTAKAAALAERIRAAFPLPAGKRQMIYTSLGYWRDRLGSPAWGANFDLWIAAWTQATAPIVPAPWTRWTLWQYTNEGDGPAHGVGSARVDLNRFNGTRAEFLAWGVEAGPVVDPAAELWALGQETQVISRNPQFAVEGAMVRGGYYPIGNERRVTVGGVPYAIHLGANAAGVERLYIAEVPKWSNVWYQDGPEATEPPPTPPADDRIDLLPYLRGDGRLYEVRHPSGATETFQTQTDGDWFYLVKNAQWEQLYADAEYIWRGADTSPGGGRFYVQFEPLMKRARWMLRHMRVGQVWVGPGHMVRFYDKATCAPSAANSGNATNRMVFIARHAARTWNGVTVPDVVELSNGSETWFYARGFGLVAWSSGWGQSAIAQVYAPGERPNLVREKLNCSY